MTVLRGTTVNTAERVQHPSVLWILEVQCALRWIDELSSCGGLDVHHDQRLYALSFSGLSSLQQSLQNVSCLHTRFQYLVHMIVICLTHFFRF